MSLILTTDRILSCKSHTIHSFSNENRFLHLIPKFNLFNSSDKISNLIFFKDSMQSQLFQIFLSFRFYAIKSHLFVHHKVSPNPTPNQFLLPKDQKKLLFWICVLDSLPLFLKPESKIHELSKVKII